MSTDTTIPDPGIQLILKTSEGERDFQFNKEIITIGRTSSSDLPILDRRVSRTHAQICREGSGYTVVDGGSQNGIRIGGNRISRKALAPGDEIRIGSAILKVLALGGTSAAAPPSVGKGIKRGANRRLIRSRSSSGIKTTLLILGISIVFVAGGLLVWNAQRGDGTEEAVAKAPPDRAVTEPSREKEAPSGTSDTMNGPEGTIEEMPEKNPVEQQKDPEPIASIPSVKDAPSPSKPEPEKVPPPIEEPITKDEYPLANPPPVKNGTLLGKVLFGYQGWHAAPGDGSGMGWHHWFSRNTPNRERAQFDIWPDLSEFDEDELYPTNMSYPDGSRVRLYSCAREKTVVRHMKWVADYGVDGVYLQRFLVPDERVMRFRNRVLTHVKKGCERYRRLFLVEYDISSFRRKGLAEALEKDWRFLVDELKVTQSPFYLRHRGRPLLALWGFGVPGRPGTPEDLRRLIRWFRHEAAGKYRVSLMAGISTGLSKSRPDWKELYLKFDVISPWLVGRHRKSEHARKYASTTLRAELNEVNKLKIDYVPVVFPGFSWHNLKRGEAPVNDIPRNGGRFFWSQCSAYYKAGAKSIKIAMLDEVDEGTAMYKLVSSSADIPQDPRFMALDRDGEKLPNDWYLRLSGEARKLYRGLIQPTDELPIKPGK